MSAFGTASKPDPRLIQIPAQDALIPYRELAKVLQPQHNHWFWLGMIAPWIIGALVLGLFVWRSGARQRESLEQSRSLDAIGRYISAQDRQLSSVVTSIKGLTEVMDSSATKNNGMEVRLQRAEREIKRLEGKLREQEQHRTGSGTTIVSDWR